MASRLPSEPNEQPAEPRVTDPDRPSDHIDAAAPEAGIAQPVLGVVGYLRFFWRQLTNMRTALFLLLLLAFAAVPGSLVPQHSSDPNGVVQYKAANPGLSKALDALGVFDTYSSVWFSAIYLLLFVSLVGCVIPRTKHHIDALRSQPPRTPAKLERLSGFRHSVADKAADAEAGVEAAAGLLRRSGYRVRRFGSAADGWSVSAERGYLRETGNLVFHFALVGILIAVGFGGGFVYSGQRVVVEGQSFSNNLANYDSFNPGRFFQDSMLVPYSITLDRFTATYEENNVKAYGQAIDYTAAVTTELPGATAEKQIIKVNSPLGVGGTDIYLLGNGYAPDITVRDGDGNIAYSQPTAFLPQDANLTSVGVIKVPDALPKQLGLIGFFYPTVCDPSICSAALTSVHPALRDPTLTLEVYTGDLGLNDGVARNAFSLNTDKLTQVAGRKSVAKTLKLKIGDTIQLPDGLGSVTFNGVKRFVSLDIHHDPTQLWVLGFAILVLAGLLTGLFIPRRRVWVKAVKTRGGVRFEYAGLARGEDPGLEAAVAEIARKHSQQLGLRLGE